MCLVLDYSPAVENHMLVIIDSNAVVALHAILHCPYKLGLFIK